MELTHTEDVRKARELAAEVAYGMLDDSINYLEGAIKLSELSFQVSIGDDNDGFLMFIRIASEVDHLPLGSVRQYWSKEAL